MLDVPSFACGAWVAPGPNARPIESAITGNMIGRAGDGRLVPDDMLRWARNTGGPALRAMTIHQRAEMLKALAKHLDASKQALYDLSFDTGATAKDHLIDVDGGIGTMFVYASKGRREMNDGYVYLDGPAESLSRDGSFQGTHICTPLQGVAVHINAFNFPVWGMLEKLAPTLLAGVPAIVKPATATCQVTQAAMRLMLESGLLPDGAVQMVSGGLGDMLDHLGPQDVVSFTGSAATGLHLRSHPNLLRNAVRFTAEQDSLNAAILGPDAGPASAEFDLFIKETIREMTVKAGQKCTAMRRLIVPQPLVQDVTEALVGRLSNITTGDPRDAAMRMGALVSQAQKQDVLARVGDLQAEARLIARGLTPQGPETGAFIAPHLLICDDPDAAHAVHEVEAFGPVATILPARDMSHAAQLANRGGGSLVTSLFTYDAEVALGVLRNSAAFNGRLYINDRDSATGATGHGAPVPHMVHGGPGRAGGGEELGGIRAVLHYMQRTALQGSPRMLGALTGRWHPGAPRQSDGPHPFRKYYEDLSIGDSLTSASREITLDDIEHFAHFTGDTFYAHMDAEAARRNPFFPDRVAHGYLLLSFAAGLFVDPDEGPVLANTGLDSLRFVKPVIAGDHLKVILTVSQKTPRSSAYGEVRWHVALLNQDDETVATYELLTMNARQSADQTRKTT